MADLCPLTVAEARAILIADEALVATYEARVASGQTFGIEELDAWVRLVKSADARIAAFGEQGVERAGKRAGYTTKHLTDADAAEIAELLRVALEDKHWIAGHQKLREIREKMIERMGDLRESKYEEAPVHGE